jgi:hypothetical protein
MPGAVQGASAGRAMEHYRRLMKASRDGNWTRFGQELDALGKVLQELKQQGK